MDKSWMYESRVSHAYMEGVQYFLDLAFSNVSIKGKIICPCVRCGNGMWVTREEAHEHLVCDGFIKGYTRWIAHGEASSCTESGAQVPGMSNRQDNIHELLHDVFGTPSEDTEIEDNANDIEEPNEKAKIFYKLLKDAEQELYPGCKKFSKLSFIIRLFHLKCLGKWTNKSFTMLLELFKEVLPEGETLPKSYYETKKIIAELGLSCTKIHACPNDCMLYWKDHENDSHCNVCNTSRYVNVENQEGATSSKERTKPIPAKVLRHFPLKPWLQRLFMSSKTASFMRWHKEGRTNDGCMRHPADSPAWRTFDYKHSDFAEDPRNVRLGLASDGFNPFRTMNVSYSTWPVILMPYNLPPWMCMKQSSFMLSLLIPGPSAPGNNIDVYLQPLIEELKELWSIGINTYDASSKQNFQMRAALMWTISDFPAYANLSGWSTKGDLACPSCHKYTSSLWLDHSGKYCYMGHRRFLDDNHVFRKDTVSFDGKEEHGKPPPYLFGSKVLDELHGLNIRFGKLVKDNPELPFGWKKQSIFFDLPYWKDNLLRHNLDVMHIEKNVCDNVMGTLLNIEGKTKDHLKARLDLKKMNIREELHPIEDESGRINLPTACFLLDKKEKEIFCNVLKKIKVPDGYASNISRSVQLKPFKISGLKSHDNHILMQQLLPLALRRVLPKPVRLSVIGLCKFFKELCSKVLRVPQLIQLEGQIAEILCNFERIFAPTFFDVMVHLSIHLATEAKLGGPVHYRWMYPIERYLSTLKSYVRNRSRPEGSIAEGYLAEECLIFCSRYLDDVETKFNRVGRNYDEGNTPSKELAIFLKTGRQFGKEEAKPLDNDTLLKAHQYVLFNCDKVEGYLVQHKNMIRDQNPRHRVRDVERIHSQTFASWFRNYVEELYLADNAQVSEELRALAWGPHEVGKRYWGFIINGFRFHTKEIEKKRKTQNSGVVVTATTTSFSSANDNNPILGDVTYYGVLKDITELQYPGGNDVVLFKCDWVAEVKKKNKEDEGFTLVTFNRLVHKDEPFILASQAQQVFYSADPIEKGLYVAIKITPRDTFDMNARSRGDDIEAYLQSETFNYQFHIENESFRWVRTDLEGF